MAIRGTQPWEFLRNLLEKENYTMDMLARYTGVSQQTISAYTRDTQTASSLVNKNFLKLLEEGFGMDIEISLVPNEKHPGGIRSKMSYADQLEMMRRNTVRRMKAEEEDYKNYFRRMKYYEKKCAEDPEYAKNHSIDDVEDEEPAPKRRPGRPRKNENEIHRVSAESCNVFDPEVKAEEERKAKHREAVKMSRYRMDMKMPKRKPGRKPKKEWY